MRRRNIFLRVAVWVSLYWVSALITAIALALVVALVFAAVPEVSDAWHRHLNRNPATM